MRIDLSLNLSFREGVFYFFKSLPEDIFFSLLFREEGRDGGCGGR